MSDRLTEEILDSTADGVFTVDLDYRVTSFNRAAEQITGVPREEARGRACWEVFKSSLCEGACPIREVRETGRPVVNRTAYIVNVEGGRVPISISASVLHSDDGETVGGVETFRDMSLVESLREKAEDKHRFEGILSRSDRMRQLFEILPVIATSESTVLIEGESGTGKELFARALHNLSSRRDRPFVAVNCGALPDNLLESELFGYRKGAFTDARQDKPGRFELAEGGTILLDEIGDMSPALQVRLLRVLQERTYEPLGSTETQMADVRVIAATNKDLNAEVESGRFRRDLFYRVNVVKLALPPLRDRREDILLLGEHYLREFCRLKGRDIAGFAEDATGILLSYDFPGNVRELENIVEHAVVLCPGGLIEARHLPFGLAGTAGVDRSGNGESARGSLEEIERSVIEAALRRHGWNRTRAAQELGIHRSTLFRKIQSLGLSPAESTE